MQNYKDSNNKIYALESEEFENYLPDGCVKISKEAAYLIANPPKTLAQIITGFEQAIQIELDSDANVNGYPTIDSAITKASVSGIFQEECIAYGKRWADSWEYFYIELDKIKNNKRKIPTTETLISELPTRVSK